MFGYRSFLGCAPGAKLQLTCICLVCVLDLALSYCDAHCVALMYEIASTKMDLSILTPVCKYPKKTLLHFSKVADEKGRGHLQLSFGKVRTFTIHQVKHFKQYSFP